ncbi:MAG TPA: hypothetical protein VHF51_17375 [Solirubrobacteraceae bacterium]|nr:hypothetical protein [Solirubrobacteraceae bacterium]
MGAHDDLLRRHQPQLRYDSNEQYFADDAAQWTDNPGNELRRADTRDGRGELIAAAVPAEGAQRLTLGFLGPEAYGDGSPVQDGDYIGDRGRDYREQYVRLRRDRPELRNKMYGHAVESAGRVWLQYWFWYFYNDYSLALGAGRHEGDWEMVQLRLLDGRPDLAVYAQHSYAERRPWTDVERAPDRTDSPVVYVARGSHASYFERGFHETEAWYDLADGKRATPWLALEIVEHDAPPWVRWPGRWGDTRPSLGAVHQSSPVGPGRKGHWRRPERLLEDARRPARPAAPAAPQVDVRREAGSLRLAFDFSRHPGDAPRALVVTVNSRDEPGVPPRAYTFGVEEAVRGTLSTRIPVDPAKHYDIYTSTTSGDPPVPSESRLTELDPVGARRPRAALALGLLRDLGRGVAWLRGQLRRR